MIERTDADGRWTSEDGAVWALVEPSDEWRTAQAAMPPPVDAVDPFAERLAEIEAKAAAIESVLVAKELVSEKELTDAKAEVGVVEAVALDVP